MKISAFLVGLSLVLSGTADARARWTPTAHGLACVSMAASEPDVLLCELGDRFQIHPDAVLAMPQILAGGFSSSSSLIGQTGEGNGYILDSATAPAATNAYVNYDGTNVVVNAPSTKGFAFASAGSTFFTISSGGDVRGGAGQQFSASGGASFFTSQNSTANLRGNIPDGASAIGTVLNNATTLSTPGAKLLSVQNNGTEQDFFDKDGNLVFNGNASGSTISGANVGIGKISGANDLVLNVASGRAIALRANGTNITSFSAAAVINSAPPQQTVSGLTESPASATNTALSSTKVVHVVTGTTTISTFTGGTEGQLAIVCYTGALTITNSTTDVLNSIHNAAYTSGTAPANFLTTSATATNPYCKQYLFTANMPGFTNGQWFEVGL